METIYTDDQVKIEFTMEIHCSQLSRELPKQFFRSKLGLLFNALVPMITVDATACSRPEQFTLEQVFALNENEVGLTLKAILVGNLTRREMHYEVVGRITEEINDALNEVLSDVRTHIQQLTSEPETNLTAA